MAFLIKRFKERMNHFMAAHLANVQTQSQIQHIQTMQALKVIASHLDPRLIGQLPSGEGQFIELTDEVSLIPNYANRLSVDDVFLLSFPRSGNTWMRTIIGGILYPHHLFQSLQDLDDYIPDLNTRFPNHNHFSSPRVIKSHQPYHQREGWQNPNLYGKFIYILRHPYKAITSYYDFERFRAPYLFTTLGDFVEQVVMGGYHFGNWQQHVISWLYGAKRAQSTLFLRYEDLQKQTIPTIIQIGGFLGKPLNEAQAEIIRQFASQENMIEMDKKGSEVPGYELVRRGDERQTKTKESLTDDMKAMIYAYNKEQMDAWGYGADGSVNFDYPNKGKYDR